MANLGSENPTEPEWWRVCIYMLVSPGGCFLFIFLLWLILMFAVLISTIH